MQGLFPGTVTKYFVYAVLTKNPAAADIAVLGRRHAGMRLKQLPKIIRIAVTQ